MNHTCVRKFLESQNSAKMGMVQSCFNPWNWFQPTLVNLENEVETPKVYSWDKKKVDLSQYSFENLQDQTVVKLPGSINGEQFMVRNCINCNIYLFDHINTITVDDCKNCKIFIGPTKVNKSLLTASESRGH